jgi:hypothetical protein
MIISKVKKWNKAFEIGDLPRNWDLASRSSYFLLLLCFLLTLPSHLPLRVKIQKHIWAQSMTQKTVTTVAKMKITNQLVRE